MLSCTIPSLVCPKLYDSFFSVAQAIRFLLQCVPSCTIPSVVCAKLYDFFNVFVLTTYPTITLCSGTPLRISNTLGQEGTVLIIEVSSFQASPGLKLCCVKQENHLVSVACVHSRGVSTIQGSGLEGFHCIAVSFFGHNLYKHIHVRIHG